MKPLYLLLVRWPLSSYVSNGSDRVPFCTHFYGDMAKICTNAVFISRGRLLYKVIYVCVFPSVLALRELFLEYFQGSIQNNIAAFAVLLCLRPS